MAAGGKGAGGGKPSKRNTQGDGEAAKVDPAVADDGTDAAEDSTSAPQDAPTTGTPRPAWPSGAAVPEAEEPPVGAPTDTETSDSKPTDSQSPGATPSETEAASTVVAEADTAEASESRPAWPSGAEVPEATEPPQPASPDTTEAALPSDTEPASAEASDSAATATPAAAGAVPAAAAAAPRRKGGMVGVLLGGAIAAGAGFLAAQYADPQGWPFVQPGQTAIDQALGAQADQLRTLETALAEVRTELAALSDGAVTGDAVAALEGRVAGLDAALAALGARTDVAEAAGTDAGDRLDALDARLADFDSRLTTVERAPIEGSDIAAAALESYTRELAELREQIDAALAATAVIGTLGDDLAALQAQVAEFPAVDDMRAEVASIAARLDEVIATNEALRAEAAAQVEAAAAAERAARARAAFIRIEAALDTGGSYADALAELEATGITIPAGLAASAAAGVSTSAQLIAGFGPAARAALALANRDLEGMGMADRFTAFIRAQLGIRSLSPREGDDPDAILSRAEAAAGADDLATALDELAALPPEPAAAMAGWIASAEARQAALAAAAAVAAELETL